MKSIYTVSACNMETDLGTGFGEAYNEKDYRFASEAEMLAKYAELKAKSEVEYYRRGSRSLKMATNLSTHRHDFENDEDAQEYLEIGGKIANEAKETNLDCWYAK